MKIAINVLDPNLFDLVVDQTKVLFPKNRMFFGCISDLNEGYFDGICAGLISTVAAGTTRAKIDLGDLSDGVCD